jgi:hypothetical protein
LILARRRRRSALTFGLALAGIAAGSRPEAAHAVPSYARQLDMPCNGCHVQFPVLNAFGRQFKLMGYTMTSQPTVSLEDEQKRKLLDLPLPSLLSVMFQTDLTATTKRQPSRTNTNVEFPDQVSLFVAGRVTPRIGTFVQLTYSGENDKFGFDNTDIRFADSTELFSKPVLWGVTLNNNPTVTDPWNSTPVWGYPFSSSPSAPTPAARPLLDGSLAKRIAGVTGYALFDDLVYTEAGVYRAAPLGVARPLANEGTFSGVAPYWRVALQHACGDTYLMLGHFGLLARQEPAGGSPRNEFSDLGFDLQIQRPVGSDVVQLLARWMYEDAHWGVGNAQHRYTDLNEFRLAATYYRGQYWSVTLSPFVTFGRRDAVLFAPGSVSGSQTGRPDSNGLVAEVGYNPWLNTRLTLQYTAYFEFNGRSNNYDGSGRDAVENNTIFLQAWLNW